MLTVATILTLLIAGAAVYLAVQWFRELAARDAGDEELQNIARAVQSGGKAFLDAGYRWLAAYTAVTFLLLGLGPADQGLGLQTAIAFVLGVTASASMTWFGMLCTAHAAARAVQAARTAAPAFAVVFRAGATIGLCAAGLCLFGIAGLTLIYQDDQSNFLGHVLGFAFGSVSVALFLRAGGVGRTVAEVLGTGADLLACYAAAIIAAAMLGFATGIDHDHRRQLIAYPLVLAVTGVLASFAGAWSVKPAEETRPGALFKALVTAQAILIVAMAAFTPLIDPQPAAPAVGETYGCWSVYLTVVIGLALGLVLDKVTDYYTSPDRAPAQEVAERSGAGPAENVIQGLITGMGSTWLPVILLSIGIWSSYQLAGTYGIGVAAVGMLATLALSLATSACGPMARNAAAGKGSGGKGLALGASALTGLVLFAAWQASLSDQLNLGHPAVPGGETAGHASMFVLTGLGNADVLMGLFLGAMMPLLFSSLVLRAPGLAAPAMVEEVQRQWRIPGIADGSAASDHARCVAISTRAALRQAVAPGLLALLAPVLTGMIFGKGAVAGMLAGLLGTGVVMAVCFTHAGGALDSARRYVAAGHLGGKDGDAHGAALVGDSVGRPLQEAVAPALLVLIKLAALAALMALPLCK